MEKHFLQNYDVHRKPEAIKAVKKKERLAGEQNLVRDYDERITAYIERLGKIFLDPGRKDKEKNEKTRRRNLEILKPTIYKNTLVKKEDFLQNTINNGYGGKTVVKSPLRVLIFHSISARLSTQDSCQSEPSRKKLSK